MTSTNENTTGVFERRLAKQQEGRVVSPSIRNSQVPKGRVGDCCPCSCLCARVRACPFFFVFAIKGFDETTNTHLSFLSTDERVQDKFAMNVMSTFCASTLHRPRGTGC